MIIISLIILGLQMIVLVALIISQGKTRKSLEQLEDLMKRQ